MVAESAYQAAEASVEKAQAESGWAPTATQGITLSNFSIQAHSLGPLPATTPLRVMLGLQLQNEAQLNSAIVAVNTPGSPSYGKFLTPSEFVATYSPSSSQIQAVESYLSRMGLTNISAPSNGLYVVANGTAAVIEAAFNTTLWQYQVSGPNGEPTRTVYANTQPAQVPASLGGIVLSVVGLQNVDTMHTFLGSWPAATPIPAVTAPSTPANPATFSPQDFSRRFTAPGKLVDPYDNSLLRFNLALINKCRVLNFALHVSSLNRRDRAAEVVDLR